ncbi:mRNA decay activator protein ZFP36L1-like isoform X1 [Acipenser ruthenus]|uniref:mRNA decay activator protein ZFP36L1-like isoform X1 n=2 Tax=Acipenser ruthenus TaxID=7906 RepID=UPI00145B5123|nr:mRNA decay activator protein ZFP36L1-like isoform X1 [Acipenser ruthenus]
MPSYVLTPFLELDEVLCKNFLNLDLKDAPRPMVPTTKLVGFKNSQSVSPHTLGGNAFNTDRDSLITDVGLCLQSSKWSRLTEQPPPPGLSKIPFWMDRSISMIESDSGSLGWAASDSSLTKQAVAPDPADTAVATATTPSSSRYKTEMCRTFEESGNCKYGAKCQFAHGYNEIRGLNRHPKYKTEFCRTFHTIGFCPYGIRCHFVHNAEEELLDRPPQQQAPKNRRPPLLRQSISFAGFPSAPHPKATSFPFSRVASTSPPPSTGIPELLSPPFPKTDSFPIFIEPGLEPGPQFLLSSDSSRSFCRHDSPTSSSFAKAPTTFPSSSSGSQSPIQPFPASLALRSRSLSSSSLSDHEGGYSSSASSLSGSESPVFEAFGRRLPIFSQLSVPDDVCASFFC